MVIKHLLKKIHVTVDVYRHVHTVITDFIEYTVIKWTKLSGLQLHNTGNEQFSSVFIPMWLLDWSLSPTAVHFKLTVKFISLKNHINNKTGA